MQHCLCSRGLQCLSRGGSILATTSRRHTCHLPPACVPWPAQRAAGSIAAAAAASSEGQPATPTDSSSSSGGSIPNGDAAGRSTTTSGSSSSSKSNGKSSGTESSNVISYPRATMGGWLVNKKPINASMSPELYEYMLNMTQEHEVLAALREETSGMHGGHMQVSPEQGRFMALLAQLMGVKSAIEVGVFTGYSSLALALALPPDGRLYAFDRDASTMAVAQKYWQLAGVAGKVHPRLGPALDGLQQLLQETGPDAFDFAFIDADKAGYQAYFDLCLSLVRPGGCIAVDNVLFYGRVVDPERQDKATLAVRRFNEGLAGDARVAYSIVPIGDGLALCRKL